MVEGETTVPPTPSVSRWRDCHLPQNWERNISYAARRTFFALSNFVPAPAS